MNSTYLVCRAHGYETRLISRSFMEELIASRSLQELVKKLEKTDYGPFLKPARGIQEVEQGITNAFVSKLAYLLKAASGRGLRFIKVYLRRYEVQNLVWIMRMKAGKASRKEVEELLLPTEKLGGLDLKPFMEAESLEALIKQINKSGAYSMPEKVKEYLLLEAELWKSYYEAVFKAASKLRVEDGDDVRKLLSLEVDLMNLRTCMLLIARSYKPEIAQGFLIENPKGISLRRLLRFLRAGDVKAFLEHFPAYRSFLERTVAGEEWAMELERLKAMKRFTDSRKIPKFISFFYVLKYILDLEIEYRNLRAVAASIYYDLPVELRRRTLASI